MFSSRSLAIFLLHIYDHLVIEKVAVFPLNGMCKFPGQLLQSPVILLPILLDFHGKGINIHHYAPVNS